MTMKNKMNNNNVLKICAGLLCIVLSFCIGTLSPLQLVAKATEPVLYVEDIRIAVINTENETIKDAQEEVGEDYIIADKVELNPGTSTGRDVYLAYKTTTNKDMAIRDIKLMSMDSGYTEYDYNEMNAYIASQNAGRAQTLADAAKAFAESYNAGSPRAQDAYKALNLFRVESNGTELLGDYIVAGKADKAFFAKMLVSSNVQALNAVIGFINIGLTPYLNEYDEESGKQVTTDWASLIPVSALWQKYESGMSADEENALAKQYQDLARDLFHQIQDFTTFYENARARAGENYENLNLDTKGDIDDAPAAMQNADENDTDVTYIVCYEKLNEYNFDENTKLGDWFLSLGRQTSDEIDIKQIYPIIDAMGENQASIVNTGGFISAVFNLVENKHNEEIDDMIESVREELGKIDKTETFYIFDNRDDMFTRRSRFAVTAESSRQAAASNPIDRTTFWWDDIYEVYYPGFTQMSFLLGAVYAAVGVVAIVAAVGGFVTGLMAGTCVAMAVISSVLMGVFSVISWVSTVIGPYFSMVTGALTAVLIGMLLINYLIQEFKKLVKKEFQTDKPDYVVDVREYKNSEINVLYECVRDAEGDVKDVNASQQWKWVVMTFTKDPRVGSPVVADKDGNIFLQVNGNAGFMKGYDSVKYFGERTPGDFNAFCKKNSVKGAYLHYHTEETIKSFVSGEDKPDDNGENGGENNENGGENSQQGNAVYLSDIVVAIADSPEAARNELIKRETKTYVFDHNLSQNQDFATYIGYSMTNDPKGAVTDIRIAPNIGQSTQSNTIRYGDVEYTYSHVLGWDTGPGSKQGIPPCDALYFTRDSRAGDPIPADNLVTATKLETYGAKDSEWIPVSYFGNDQPYNFEMHYEVWDDGTGINFYATKKDNYLNKMPSSYLYFKPENARNSGERYLSGLFFIGGTDWRDTVFDDVEAEVSELWDKVLQNGKTETPTPQNDLSWSVGNRKKASIGNLHSHLLYTWTYYPKRALTNAVIYQGDSYSDSLPYTMSKALGGVQQNFIAATNIQQQFWEIDKIYRFVMPGNIFMNYACGCAMNREDVEYVKRMVKYRTKTLAEGVPFGYKKMPFLPTALYLCGPVSGKDPLKLSDVIITEDTFECTYDNGVYHYDTEHAISPWNGKDKGAAYTLAPDPNGRFHDSKLKATGEFRPVVDVKNPYSTNAFNLAYPDSWDEDDEFQRNTRPYYIYLRGQQTDKPKYISALSVGAYSRAQFKKDNPDQDSDLADSMVEGTAMFAAASGCADEMIVYNIAVSNQNDAWYNRQSGGKGKTDAPGNKPAAYIGVTRTDDPNKAITGVLLYQMKEMIAPNEITCNGVKYTCAGSTMPIVMNGKNYFLYYSRNSGDSAGLPVEDITIDTTPIIPGHATNLCADSAHSEPYGNPDQTCFIHTKYTGNREFFNKLYIGTGKTKRAAMCDLLSQGCVECLDLDINDGIQGETVLLGYRMGAVNPNAKKTVQDLQRQEIIYDIIITCGEPYQSEGIINKGVYYHPLGNYNLNGEQGRELYLYYASAYYSSEYNKTHNADTLMPQDVFTGYVTKMALAKSDRVPYNETSATAGAQGQSLMRWEYVMQSGEKTHADLNRGAVGYSSNRGSDVRISMFVQRSDGSVKPSGEITGGFVESTYDVGNLEFG
ncbi:MAG: hypothetical protein J5562_01995 [Clostridia bacterium]|nr:hypothetical protein [Clostridia bacterium]